MTVTLHHEINNPLMSAFAERPAAPRRSAMDAEGARALAGRSRPPSTGSPTSSGASATCAMPGPRATPAGPDDRPGAGRPAAGCSGAPRSCWWPTRTWPGSCRSCCGTPASRSSGTTTGRARRARRRESASSWWRGAGPAPPAPTRSAASSRRRTGLPHRGAGPGDGAAARRRRRPRRAASLRSRHLHHRHHRALRAAASRRHFIPRRTRHPPLLERLAIPARAPRSAPTSVSPGTRR